MKLFVPLGAAILCLVLAACGAKPESLAEVSSQRVILPAGQEIQVETMMKPKDMMSGMQYRDAMLPGHGMLFIHPRAGNYTYWMHLVKVPLDIIWLDREKRIVEISPNTPPCTSKDAVGCPMYGGHAVARFVLELNGGLAEKYGLKVGQQLSF
jgi:uncharacterized protein